MASHEQLLRAVQVATRKLASSGKFDQLLNDVLSICVDAVGASGGTIYLHDAAKKALCFQFVKPAEVAEKLQNLDIPDDFGLAGRAFQEQRTVTKELPPKPESEANDFEKATGVIVRSMIATPLMMEGEAPIGVVQLINKSVGSFDASDAAVLETIAAVSTMAYLNYRLTEEASRASSLLGMGKVSHDIGNLAASLHATLAYAEPTLEGLAESLPHDPNLQLYIDMLRDTQVDMSKSIDRIVGYARLISDLSVGRALRPTMVLAPMAQTISTSAAYLATEARRNYVALHEEIDYNAPPVLHDELYIFRIVQNLVGNAIKAVRETIPDHVIASQAHEDATFGEVTVLYRLNDDGYHCIEVRDSGPGMTPEIARRILTGNAASQWGKGSGSGWGMKIVLELAATHQAPVTIDSELGKGSTFRVAIPPRTEIAESASEPDAASAGSVE